MSSFATCTKGAFSWLLIPVLKAALPRESRNFFQAGLQTCTATIYAKLHMRRHLTFKRSKKSRPLTQLMHYCYILIIHDTEPLK